MPAPGGQLGDRFGFGGHPLRAQPGRQQPHPLLGVKRAQPQRARPLRGGQPGQRRPAGHHHEAPRTAGQQRPHLRRVAGVVQHDQHPPPGQHAAVQPAPRLRIGRDLGGRYPQGGQEPARHLLRGDRRALLVVAAQVHIQLPVREPARHLTRPLHRQRGLAHSGHPRHRRDHHRPTRPSRPVRSVDLIQQGVQLLQLRLPAGEKPRSGRQLPRHYPRRRSLRLGRHRAARGRRGGLTPYGRQHLRGRDPPAGRRHEHRAHRLSQAQRARQQHGGVLAGRKVDAPLQVADRPRAQACRLRQLLLRQPGPGSQLPQQVGESQRRRLRHGRHPPPRALYPAARQFGTAPKTYVKISQARLSSPSFRRADHRHNAAVGRGWAITSSAGLTSAPRFRRNAALASYGALCGRWRAGRVYFLTLLEPLCEDNRSLVLSARSASLCHRRAAPAGRRVIYRSCRRPCADRHGESAAGDAVRSRSAGLDLATQPPASSAGVSGRSTSNSLPSGSAMTTQLTSPWPMLTRRAPSASSRATSAACRLSVGLKQTSSSAADRAVAAGRCFFSGAARRHRMPGAGRSPGRVFGLLPGGPRAPVWRPNAAAGAAARPRCCERGVRGDGYQLLRHAVAGT